MMHERAAQRREKPAWFTIVAAGDVLPHGPLNASATRDGKIDYTPLLAGLDPWIQGADLALCHLEAPVAPPGTAPSGYPAFAAPKALIRDLAEQGWHGCSTASNHSMDRGVDGVTATLDAFDEAGLGFAGTGRDADERAPQRYTLERAGREVTVAHLSATYGLNGFSVPEDRPWTVDLLDADRIVRDAKAARRAGADLVVVSMHAGTEYVAEPTDEQKAVARRLAASRKVDLIIGHHAHIPQRVARLDGGPGGAGMWVAYGLGNMISNQSSECCDARTTNGVLLTATVTQPEPGAAARVTGVEWTATTVDRAAGHRLRALVDAIDDPGSGTLSEAELQRRMDAVRDVGGGAAPERTAPPTPTGGEPEISR
jgi:poly-gamma-glutamate synthesis protein (capsule biosynthesis protein)